MVANAKLVAAVLGIVFLGVGVLGFFNNPLVGPAGIFVVNPMHNYVHIISGIVLLMGAYSSFLSASLALKIIGVIYGIVAVLGFVMPGDMMLGMVAMNAADRWLHVVLALVMLFAGFALATARKPAIA